MSYAAGDGSHASALFSRAATAADTARLVLRVLRDAGALAHATPAGALLAMRTLLRGGSGPSAVIRIHAANAPHRTAFVSDGRALSYGALDARIDRLATGLRARGVGAGTTAVVLLKNRPECFEVSAALSRLGGASVSASWRSTPMELAYLFQHSGARAVFFEPELSSTVRDALAARPELPRDALFSVGAAAPGAVSLDDVRAARPEPLGAPREGSVIIYTSGTTGRPKGAVRRFGAGQLHGYFAFVGETPMRADDRHLAVCPMYHSTGLGFVGMALMLGAQVHLAREFDPDAWLAAVARERITTATLVPTMLHRLMALPDETFTRHDTRCLRALFCGGAPLPAPLAQRTLERLGPVLFNFYGATETGLVTVATPDELRAAPGTIGHAVPGTDIRLLDAEGREVSDGEVGELFARNAMLVDGYHDDETATRDSVRDGFFSVGDLARRDALGLFHVAGRKRDMVISGGVNVYPVEVEAVLDAHPDVAQSAVIGVPDDEWGERLRAFVVRRATAPASAAELRAWCRARLSGAKVPREWVFLEALPANATGKVLKRELAAYAGAVERPR